MMLETIFEAVNFLLAQEKARATAPDVHNKASGLLDQLRADEVEQRALLARIAKARDAANKLKADG